MKILQQQNQIFVGAFADKMIIQRKKRMDPNWPVWSQKLPILVPKLGEKNVMTCRSW